MKEIMQALNKKVLADATGLSYDRLRKYSCGILKDLREDEKVIIKNYLLQLAEKI